MFTPLTSFFEKSQQHMSCMMPGPCCATNTACVAQVPSALQALLPPRGWRAARAGAGGTATDRQDALRRGTVSGPSESLRPGGRVCAHVGAPLGASYRADSSPPPARRLLSCSLSCPLSSYPRRALPGWVKGQGRQRVGLSHTIRGDLWQPEEMILYFCFWGMLAFID